MQVRSKQRRGRGAAGAWGEVQGGDFLADYLKFMNFSSSDFVHHILLDIKGGVRMADVSTFLGILRNVLISMGTLSKPLVAGLSTFLQISCNVLISRSAQICHHLGGGGYPRKAQLDCGNKRNSLFFV